MRRVLFVVVTMVALFIGGDRYVFAASRPIKQLPADMARWSMMWTVVPKQVYSVGRKHGPFAALIWGPVKGTAKLIQSTVKEAWDTVKPDKNRVRYARSGRPKGVIFRYEF